MALPTILVNSATGSDSLASGAGPGTALTGSSASTDLGGTVVTLDGSPDLSGVATDGSHVIYLADTTAGARNFGKIIAKDDGADTVTVADAFGVGLTGKAWAIGGVRASVGSTTSAKLFENNGAAGDAMPGWIIEMQSGHTETRASTITWRRAGTSTAGPIILRGASGAVTKPILTFSNNGNAFSNGVDLIVLSAFEMRNTNATKTASVAVSVSSSSARTFLYDLVVSHSSDKYWKGVVNTSGGGTIIAGCYFANLASDAITLGGYAVIRHCRISTCAGHGITNSASNVIVLGNTIDNNTGDGIRYTSTSSGTGLLGMSIMGNTVYSNTSDGFEATGTSTATGAFKGLNIVNNIFAKNGGYGLNFSGASVDATFLHAGYTAILNNCFGSGGTANTSGAANPASIDTDSQSVDPQFTDAGSGDFTIGTNLKALGYSTANFPGTTKRTYTDIGAYQREESGSGSGIARLAGGGLVR